MDDKRNWQIIYIFGAGRSGTTILATLLGSVEEIITVGEMHQFVEHMKGKKKCSCGKAIAKCENFWGPIISELSPAVVEDLSSKETILSKLEAHRNIPFLMAGLINNSSKQEYLRIQELIFDEIKNHTRAGYILDSSKYIARALLLDQLNKFNVKYIYLVRDVRGVINSFKKNVQTSKNRFQSYLYYNLINFFGEIFYRTLPERKVMKIKYENLTTDPVAELERLQKYLGTDLSRVVNIIEKDEYFEMPHFIGGNRIRKRQKIKLKKNKKTKYVGLLNTISYLLSFPLMYINDYKV